MPVIAPANSGSANNLRLVLPSLVLPHPGLGTFFFKDCSKDIYVCECSVLFDIVF